MNYFCQQAGLYAQFRPDYPRQLFQFIAAAAPARHVAWDCATGNGQAALGLAEFFEQVIATDLSREQLANARPHSRIQYRQTAAEASGLPSGAVSAAVVTQALHWLDLQRFYPEVERVLQPAGVLVVTLYKDPELEDPELNQLVRRYNHETVGPCWPAECSLVGDDYRSAGFPFPQMAVPDFKLEREWNLEQLCGYLRSWSATVRYINAHGVNPVDEFEAAMQRAGWSNPQQARRVRWEFMVKAGRKP